MSEQSATHASQIFRDTMGALSELQERYRKMKEERDRRAKERGDEKEQAR